MSRSGRSERSDRSGRSFRTIRTSRTIRTIRTIFALLLAFLPAALSAHHGSADYDTTKEITITGVVREWRWAQPHTWIYVTVTPDSGAEVWEGEGPPLSWAEQRGWSASTLRAGETVTVVMYPSRRGPRTGLVRSIRRANGETLPVSRPWLPRG